MLTIWFPSEEPHGLEERVQWLRNRAWLATQGRLVDSPSDSSGALLVVTDPLFVPADSLVDRLLAAARDDRNAILIPAAAASAFEDGSTIATTYSTPRELSADAASISPRTRRVRWSSRELPLMLLMSNRSIHELDDVRQLLTARDVYVVEDAIAHRFASLRGNRREDLAARVPPSARSILDLGCGEGALGAAIKQARAVRVVGIESDSAAAQSARSHLDTVHVATVEATIASIDETFDAIVAGDVLEHMQDPWRTMRELHRVSHAGTRLIASIPNIASWPIVADLLEGRFDYVYAGLLCAGHLRFFTRASITELFGATGWKIETIESQRLPDRPEHSALHARLATAELSPDLGTAGFIVTAIPA